MSRHVLVLAAAYPPWPNAPATRARGFVRGLARLGYEVSVVTASTHFGEPPRDEGVEVDAAPWIDPRSIATRFGLQKTPLGRPRTRSGGTRAASPLLQVAARIAVPDLYASWLPLAAARARRRLRPDSVIWSTGPASGHVAARIAQREHPWVADVNDLWWQNPFRETGTLRSSIDRALEAQTIGHATALTTVNETIRAELERRWSRPADVILSGFDPDELPPRSRQNGELRLLFAGTLYPTVDLSPLFAGISAIIQDRSVSRKRIELRFVGGGAARFALQAESHGLADLCKAGDPVPRSELLQELVDADALVLPVYREQADILQMRFFEYVGAGRPIIALGPTDKLSSRIVREEGLGVSVSTPEEMEDALTRLLTDPEGGIPVNERARARFTWDERIRDLARVLERAAGRL